jgi:HlyD family secretion protein
MDQPMDHQTQPEPQQSLSAPDTEPVTRVHMTRRRWVAAVAVGSTLLAAAGFAASQVIKSPAQAAADTKPPAADVLTAPVERRVLKETVVLRGTVAAGESVTVTPVAGGEEGAAAPVVTKLPVGAGGTVRAGQLLPGVRAEGRAPRVPGPQAGGQGR